MHKKQNLSAGVLVLVLVVLLVVLLVVANQSKKLQVACCQLKGPCGCQHLLSINQIASTVAAHS